MRFDRRDSVQAGGGFNTITELIYAESFFWFSVDPSRREFFMRNVHKIRNLDGWGKFYDLLFLNGEQAETIASVRKADAVVYACNCLREDVIHRRCPHPCG